MDSNKSESTTVSSQAPKSLFKIGCCLMWKEKRGHRATAWWWGGACGFPGWGVPVWAMAHEVCACSPTEGLMGSSPSTFPDLGGRSLGTFTEPRSLNTTTVNPSEAHLQYRGRALPKGDCHAGKSSPWTRHHSLWELPSPWEHPQNRNAGRGTFSACWACNIHTSFLSLQVLLCFPRNAKHTEDCSSCGGQTQTEDK